MKYFIVFFLLSADSIFAQVPSSYVPLWPIQKQISTERHNALVQWLSYARPIGEEWNVDWQESAPLRLRQMKWVLVEHRKIAPSDVRQDRILVHLNARGYMTTIEIR